MTLDGQPFSGALVEFNPQFEPPRTEQSSKKSRQPRFGGSVAVTGPDGKYVLQFDNRRKGAIVGRHSLKVSDLPEDEEGPPTKVKVTRRYSVKTSTSVEVEPGQNEVDIELVSKKVAGGRGMAAN